MQTFDLLFFAGKVDAGVEPVTRTIVAPNHAWALRIGSAMVGEPIARWQSLDHFVGAIQTNSVELSLGKRYLSSAAIWGYILSRLSLTPGKVRWFYNWHIGLPRNPQGHVVHTAQFPEEAEIVGFDLRS